MVGAPEPAEHVAIVYVHGIGSHPRSTIKEHFAEDMRRALQRETWREHPSDRWEGDAVAGVLGPGGVISAQRLSDLDDDDRLRPGVPQVDVYELPWSATARNGAFRWSAILWAAHSARNIGSVVRFRPPLKALSDVAAAALLGLAVVVTMGAAVLAALFGIMVLTWFPTAPLLQRFQFVGVFVASLALLAFVKLIVFFVDMRLGAAPPPEVVRSRTAGRNPRRRFWRFAYDRLPAFNSLGAAINAAYIAVFWFIMVVQIPLALRANPKIPPVVALYTEIALFAVLIGAGLVRWLSKLEDLFGDIVVFAAEDPLNGEHVARREAIVGGIRALVAAVASARPAGQPYARIVLVAHSLGSALLGDYLAEDADRASLGDAAAAARLRAATHVVVYGSPIATFRRFFASRASAERRRREARFAELVGSGVSTPSGPLRIELLNVWCTGDVISNPFPAEMGRCVNREIGGIWALAHVTYGRSREFWRTVFPALLGDRPEASAVMRPQRS